MLPVEQEFEKFMREPEITLFMDGMKPRVGTDMLSVIKDCLKCAFMEGMLYAQKRCDAEHGL